MLRALAIAVFLAACGGGSKKDTTEPTKTTTTSSDALSNTQPEPTPPPAPASPNEKALVAMADFEAKMCACKDNACMTKVSDEMTKWSQQVAQEQKEPLELSEDEMKRMTAMGTHMADCMQKLMSQP